MSAPREVDTGPNGGDVKANVRLDEFDKAEWRDVARRLAPQWTDEDFDREWAEFQEMKRKRAMQ